MKEEKSFLGTGWSFPPSFDNKKKACLMVDEEEDIRQSLRLILFTSYGERVMQPTFGSNISDTIFDAMDAVTVNALTDNITSAIIEFEPRITLENVHIDLNDIYDGRLNIDLTYTIRKINVRTNIVFPYYFKEGTNISEL